ncbi:MAG: glutathione S-transferase N-terminal domain-containing protein [Candidatus Pacebacteria bacterium]|nr:glutathione S-transferase N-terminal domain-containing protein [Candidatus Paceibacterota bacterium]
MKKVIMYSTPACGYCNVAKDFFDEKGIECEVFDVSADEAKRQELVDISGQMGVPVIVIGEDVVIGFDQAKISELLSL